MAWCEINITSSITKTIIDNRIEIFKLLALSRSTKPSLLYASVDNSKVIPSIQIALVNQVTKLKLIDHFIKKFAIMLK